LHFEFHPKAFRGVRHPFAPLSIALALAVALSARAATHDLVAKLFQPFLAERVTLAPDGRHIAYTEHVKNELHIVIMTLEPPYAKMVINVDDDRAIAFSKEKERAALRFLRWATPNRLVFAPTEEVIPFPGGSKIIAPVMAVDADGKNPRTLIDASDLVASVIQPSTGEAEDHNRSSSIVGFPVGDRDHLIVQALGTTLRVAGDALDSSGAIIGSAAHAPAAQIALVLPTTLYKVDVRTGKQSRLGEEYLSGWVGYDWQGRSRVTVAAGEFSRAREFALLKPTPLKFNEPWLGPLAGHFTITPANYFGERAYPLGFDPNPDIVYVASNVGRDTFGVYALNLKTKTRTELALERPHTDLAPLEPTYPGTQLVFDEFKGRFAGVRGPGPKPVAVWQDPEIAAVQRALDRKFPQRTVEILEWSEPRNAFLIHVTGGTEPGRHFVYQRPENLVLEILRGAPWLAAADLHATEFFEFDPAPGVHLSGYLTRPHKSRLNPPPALVIFADSFPANPQPEFDRESQVLASLGFIVIRLNHRGVGGFGIKHRDAILAGVDRVPVDDALAAVDWVAARHPIDRKRVATFGNAFGGYLAVRALQLHPEAFRCAVAINAPLDLRRWVSLAAVAGGGEVGQTMDFAQEKVNFPQEVNRAFLQRGTQDLRTLSALDHPETLTNAVCLILDTQKDDEIALANSRLRDEVRKQGGVADYFTVNPDYAAGTPDARARVYDHLEEFFNLNLYDYNVKVGPTQVIK
jgi:pimeloyl-ACP methyl ester carboxylesterase